jgi:LacI family transcriptional regulator
VRDGTKPTIHDVARRAGVSSITVSRVINASAPVNKATRKRVEAAMKALDYIPNAFAQGLKGRSTCTIGLVVGDVQNPFFTMIARGVEDVALSEGYSVILCNSDDDPEKQDTYLDVLRRKRVDGLIITPAGDDPELIIDWKKRVGPVCILDRTLSGLNVTESKVDLVRGENTETSESLVSHLLGHGHKKIGILGGPPSISTARERLRGYRNALQKAGIEPSHLFERVGQFTVKSGRSTALSLLQSSSPPTAIFAANNLLAMGALVAAKELGLSVPEEIALVAFENVSLVPELSPLLTSAAQPAMLMGQRAAKFLLERLSADSDLDGRELVLPTEITIRGSCGCLDPNTSAKFENRFYQYV